MISGAPAAYGPATRVVGDRARLTARASRLPFEPSTSASISTVAPVTSDDNWENHTESLEIVRVPCRFGGERPYFICQGRSVDDGCGRRVGKLYRSGKRFLCRHCCQLTYESQCEDRLMRLRRKVRKARARLDPGASSWSNVQKPKGMWQRTYDRLHRRAFELECKSDQEYDRRCAQLEQQPEKKTDRGSPRGRRNQRAKRP